MQWTGFSLECNRRIGIKANKGSRPRTFPSTQRSARDDRSTVQESLEVKKGGGTGTQTGIPRSCIGKWEMIGYWYIRYAGCA